MIRLTRSEWAVMIGVAVLYLAVAGMGLYLVLADRAWGVALLLAAHLIVWPYHRWARLRFAARYAARASAQDQGV